VLAGDSTGFEKLERSLALALEAGLDEGVAQAYTNLGGLRVGLRDYAPGDRYLEEGIAYCRERDLNNSMLYMIAWQARSRLEQGDFDQAAACAALALGRPGVSALTRIQALASILGRGRRGGAGAGAARFLLLFSGFGDRCRARPQRNYLNYRFDRGEWFMTAR
jgi:hypothetical protein